MFKQTLNFDNINTFKLNTILSNWDINNNVFMNNKKNQDLLSNWDLNKFDKLLLIEFIKIDSFLYFISIVY